MIALAAPVFLSDDINRYIWDGRVQAAGINPYRYIPTDPKLAALRDQAIFPNINRNNYAPTIYPPVAQMLFLVANRFGETVLAIKLVFVTLEAVGIGTLFFVLRAAGSAAGAHLALCLAPAAGMGDRRLGTCGRGGRCIYRPGASRRCQRKAHLVGYGARRRDIGKFFPLVLAPALWRPAKSNFGDWRWTAAFIAVIVAAYLPYIGVGSRALGFLPGYVAEENFGSGAGFWLLDMARRAIPIPLAAYLGLTMSVIGGLAIGALRRRPDPRSGLNWAMALGTAALFFASPHYPWYFVWLVALLTVAPWWPAWWLTLTAVLLYWDPKTGNIPSWVGFTLYGGFVILCIVDTVWRTISPQKVRSTACH